MSDFTARDAALLDGALAVRFDSDAGDDLSLREWLTSLLERVWDEEEGFNGKRPWGNSGWASDPAPALIRGGFLEGVVDEDGYPEGYSDSDLDRLIKQAIARMTEAPNA